MGCSGSKQVAVADHASDSGKDDAGSVQKPYVNQDDSTLRPYDDTKDLSETSQSNSAIQSYNVKSTQSTSQFTTPEKPPQVSASSNSLDGPSNTFEQSPPQRPEHRKRRGSVKAESYDDVAARAGAEAEKETQETIDAAQKALQSNPLTPQSKPERSLSSPTSFDPRGDVEHAADGILAQECACLPDWLRNNFVFTQVSKDELGHIMRSLRRMEIPADTNIIREGEPGEVCYILAQGEAEVITDNQLQKRLVPGESFGELALLYNSTRKATVRSRTPCAVYAITRSEFRKIIVSSSAKMMREHFAFLKRVNIFNQLTDAQIIRLAEALQRVNFSTSDEIIRQGEQGDHFFLIAGPARTSQVKVIKTYDDGSAVELMRLGVGSYFGEQALLNDAPRAATVVAASRVQCLMLHRDQFVELLGPLEISMRQQHTRREQRELAKITELDRLRRNVPNIDSPKTLHTARSVPPRLSRPTGERHSLGTENTTDAQANETNDQNDPTSNTRSNGKPRLVLDIPGTFKHTARDGERRRSQSARSADRGRKHDLSPSAVQIHSPPSQPRREFFTSLDKARVAATGQSVGWGMSLQAKHSFRSIHPSLTLSSLQRIAVLGEGAYGRVHLVRHVPTGQLYAMKQMHKAKIVQHKQQRNILNEKSIMMRLSHPLMLQLVKTFRDDHCLYMLMEYLPGGDMFSLLTKTMGTLTSEVARFYASNVICVLSYLHAKQIVFRDLKPENLVLDADGFCRLVDFGFAKYVPDRTYTLCGTPEYLAPEVIQGRGHHRGVDYWGMGVLIYEMLIGCSPFADRKNDQMEIYRNVLRGRVYFPRSLRDEQAKDLILRLLVIQPQRRLGCLQGGPHDIMRHQWFHGVDFQAIDQKTAKAPRVWPSKPIQPSNDLPPPGHFEIMQPYTEDGTRWDEAF